MKLTPVLRTQAFICLMLFVAAAFFLGCVPASPPPLSSNTSANATPSLESPPPAATEESPAPSVESTPTGSAETAATDPAPTTETPAPATTEEQVAAAGTGERVTPPATAKGYEVDPLDWPYWRGPEMNGVSRETGLIDNFDPEGGEAGNVVWRRDDLGTRSNPIVMRGKLYTLCRSEPETPREGERVVCVDAVTGKTIWEHRFPIYESDVPDTRVAWSSVVGDPTTGRVYALGVCGLFFCLEGDTGKVVWSSPMHERFGLLSTYGGRTNMPVVYEDLVVISAVIIGWGEMARPAHRYIGFDKNTGEVVWFNSTTPLPDDNSYGSAVIKMLGDQMAFVVAASDGKIWAFQPRTGSAIWNFSLSPRGLNLTPAVVGNNVFIGQSEENITGTTMGTMVGISGLGKGDITKTGQLWKVEGVMVGKSSPLVIDDRVYCIDDGGRLFILNAKTGEEVELDRRTSKLGRNMRSSPLYADGKVYAISENGQWTIFKPSAENGIEIVNSGRFPDGEESNGSPICSHGRIYIPTTGAIYCLQDKSKTPGATERPAEPQEHPVSEDPKPALVQVVPCELLLRPGQKQPLTVRLFNSRGQLLREEKGAAFELNGPGEVTAEGVFVADSSPKHSATIVTAKVGDLTGITRIRTVPDLPWKFDFEDVTINPMTNTGEPPVTGVGIRYRHVIREIDGNKVMVKVTTIPKGTRSQGWLGLPDLSNYTIQADVMGAVENNLMPDIGIMAQGYTLDLSGNNQTVEVRSWVPQELKRKTIPFSWEGEKWYTMKLRASMDGDTAVLKGKVWLRDSQEPAEWTIEWTEESGVSTGSPGLFGNANTSEIFLDNILVTPN